MNLSTFISKRLAQKNTGSFSSTVHVIAIGSVAVGLTIMVLAFFILGGFKKEIYKKNFSFAGHINISTFARGGEEMNFPVSKESNFYLSKDSIESIEKIQNVAYKFGLMKTDEGVSGLLLKGVDQSWDSLTFSQNLIEGKIPNISGPKSSNDLVISKYNSDLLNLKIGDRVTITFIQEPPRYRKLTISGIYETGMEEFDQSIGLCDMRLVQKLNRWTEDEVGGFEVYVKDFEQLNEAESELLPYLDYNLTSTKITNKFRNTFDWLVLIDRQVLLFIALILFVACFNMVSVLLILIMEKTQMIGILKSIGASNQLVRQVFLKSGLIIVLKGLLIGNISTLLIAFLQDYFKIIPLDFENYFMHFVPISWDWTALVLINIMIIIIVGVTLVIPTVIINRVDPVSSIKFD